MYGIFVFPFIIINIIYFYFLFYFYFFFIFIFLKKDILKLYYINQQFFFSLDFYDYIYYLK